MVTTNEQYLEELIGNVVGKSDPSLLAVLAGDVLQFDAWLDSDNPDEVQVDYGDSLADLTSSSDQKLLSRAIRSYVLQIADPADIDEIVRLCMERIVKWQKWYPEWIADKNYDDYFAATDDYGNIYDDSDYGIDNDNSTSSGVFL